MPLFTLVNSFSGCFFHCSDWFFSPLSSPNSFFPYITHSIRSKMLKEISQICFIFVYRSHSISLTLKSTPAHILTCCFFLPHIECWSEEAASWTSSQDHCSEWETGTKGSLLNFTDIFSYRALILKRYYLPLEYSLTLSEDAITVFVNN